MVTMATKYIKEELEIVDYVGNNNLQSVFNLEEMKGKLKKAAYDTLTKRKHLSLRLYFFAKKISIKPLVTKKKKKFPSIFRFPS